MEQYNKEYFENRKQIEQKHRIMVQQWTQYFNPKRVLDVGCGCGQVVYCFQSNNIWCHGFDISEWAVNHPCNENIRAFLFKENILDNVEYITKADLVIAFDILEHLNNTNEVEIALRNIYKLTNRYILISVPVIGDINLELDSTHLIKKTKEWWLWHIKRAGFKTLETPKTWLFSSQIIIGEKK